MKHADTPSSAHDHLAVHGGHTMWDSPAYEQLIKHGLMRTDWRKADIDSLDLREGNTTPAHRLRRQLSVCLFPPAAYFLNTAEVSAGSIRCMQNGRGGYEFLGNRGAKQGIHACARPLPCFLMLG